MIGWVVPLKDFPDTYNKQPLAYAGLAAQKNYNSLYLNCVYASKERHGAAQGGVRGRGQEARHGQELRSLQKAPTSLRLR